MTAAKEMAWDDLKPGDVVVLHPEDWGTLMAGVGGSEDIRTVDIAGATAMKDRDGVATKGQALVICAWPNPYPFSSFPV